jgi:large subunit ribosomal protein L4
MPLRKDLLHRAVIYEGDASRRGTASTKHRSEVFGSRRKVLPQKGTGRARAGHRQSPIRKGGGVAHGPHPRDFSTGLPKKVYDKAWRTALSYRLRKDELKIVDDVIDLPDGATSWFMNSFYETLPWGQGCGRSLFLVDTISDRFGEAMANMGKHGLVKDIEDVDVKDLLELGRIVIERRVLDALLVAHASDIASEVPLHTARHYVGTGYRGSAKMYEQLLNRAEP